MRQALAAARRAAARGEVPVGAVVVRGGEVLGRGSNATITAADPSAHAEVVAMRRAARAAGNHRLTGATLYVTLEPCLMCLGAMVQARLERVVFAAADPKSGAAALARQAGVRRLLNHQFRIEGGLLREEAGEILREFFRERRGKARKAGPAPGPRPKAKSRRRAR